MLSRTNITITSFIVALLLFSNLHTYAQSVDKVMVKASQHSLIGMTYNDEKLIPQFKAYRYMGGGLINYTYSISNQVEYALSQMYKPGKLILILSKSNEDATNGKWKLLDTVSVKQNIYNGSKYTLVTEGCTVNNKIDNLVFAILPYYQYKKILRNPLRVFKVDKINDKIIELKNRTGVFCINNAYGDID